MALGDDITFVTACGECQAAILFMAYPDDEYDGLFIQKPERGAVVQLVREGLRFRLEFRCSKHAQGFPWVKG
jgi:hypothetical protein